MKIVVDGVTRDMTPEEEAEINSLVSQAKPILPSISDRQFFQQMAIDGRITQAEALAAVGTGTIPAAMNALINMLPADKQFDAKMLITGATVFQRDNDVTKLIGQLYGLTSAQIDQIWISAAKL